MQQTMHAILTESIESNNDLAVRRKRNSFIVRVDCRYSGKLIKVFGDLRLFHSYTNVC